MRASTEQQLKTLADLSVNIGKNPLLTQAAGGNTSIKIDDTLWVKASGKWLTDAASENIFVPLHLNNIRQRIKSHDDDPAKSEVIDALLNRNSNQNLRPSIETTLHALMPHKLIAHVHSVNTIAWAVRTDAQQQLAKQLDGLNWAWVSYCRPGLPLTQSIARVMQEKSFDVLVMGNHGLVVGSETSDGVYALIEEVEERLTLPVRDAPEPDLEKLRSLAAGSQYDLPQYESGHAIATDATNMPIAQGGSLYPDHVIFLGAGTTELKPEQDILKLTNAPAILLVAGAGVLRRNDLAKGAEELIQCLADVLVRIPAGAALSYLTDEQDDELLNWDAEKYRQNLAARR